MARTGTATKLAARAVGALSSARRRACEALRHQPGRLAAFVGGGTLAVASMVLLNPSVSRQAGIVLGAGLMGLGCLVDYIGHRHPDPRHEEEIAMLRLRLEVEEADGRDRQARVEELERELSTHSRALARLLGD